MSKHNKEPWLYCWSNGPATDDGMSTTCVRKKDHDGEHEWTRDDKITMILENTMDYAHAPEEQPLRCEVTGGRLVISVGINVLAFAAADPEVGTFVEYDDITETFWPRYRVVDKNEFAKDCACAITREEEDGSSPLSKLLDQAARDAADDGCTGLEENPFPRSNNDE